MPEKAWIPNEAHTYERGGFTTRWHDEEHPGCTAYVRGDVHERACEERTRLRAALEPLVEKMELKILVNGGTDSDRTAYEQAKAALEHDGG